MALELIELVAGWFPDDEIIITGDSAYGGQSILSYLPPNVHLISHVASQGSALRTSATQDRKEPEDRPARKGERLPGMKQWAEDANQPWTELKFNQFGLHATLRSRRFRPCTTRRAVIDF